MWRLTEEHEAAVQARRIEKRAERSTPPSSDALSTSSEGFLTTLWSVGRSGVVRGAGLL